VISNRLVAAVVLALALGPGPLAWAHDPGISTTAIELERAEVHLRMGLAAADLQLLLPAGARFTGAWTEDRMAAARADLLKAAPSLWTIGGDTGPVSMLGATLTLTAGNELKFNLRYPRPPGDRLYLRFEAFDRLPPNHRDFLTWNAAAGRSRFDALLSAAAPATVMLLPAAAPPGAPAGFLSALHIRWSRSDPWIRWAAPGLASILGLAGLAWLLRLIRNR
jgi:hypothetical protein